MQQDEWARRAVGEEPLMRALTEPMHQARRVAAVGWGVRVLLWMLQGVRVGSLDVHLAGGATRSYRGTEPGPHGVMHIHDGPGMTRQIVRNGEVGVGESYMAGAWDSPDLAALLAVLYLNEPHYLGPYEKNPVFRMLGYLGSRLRQYSRARVRDNVAAHYDLGNDFYALWLDETLTYSSAIFGSPDESLADAQRRKYDRMLDRLALAPGHHLLEIGSGWGGFALHAARATGCRVTGITLSPEQLREAQARAHAAGLADRVRFELRDYRDLQGQYDRVVSIEMYEAVGEKHWPDYFAMIHRSLVPGGRAALQGITIDASIFDAYRNKLDFIQRYVFPGGMLATRPVLEDHARRAGLAPVAASSHGLDYAQTLSHWQRNVLAQADAIVRRFDERFLRLWRYYLAYCECGFRVRKIDLLQLTLTKEAA